MTVDIFIVLMAGLENEVDADPENILKRVLRMSFSIDYILWKQK